MLSLNNFSYFPKTNFKVLLLISFSFIFQFKYFIIFFSFFFDNVYHHFQKLVKVDLFKFFFLFRENNFLI